jgi:hypothetical protein
MLVLGIDVGIINLAACLAEVNAGQPAKVVDCLNLRIGNPKDSINDLIKRLVHAIHEHSATMIPDGLQKVVIEQQLGRVATKNYALSAALLAFYESASLRGGGLLEVTTQNPRNKFKKLSQMDLPCLDLIRSELITSRGKELKKLSIKAADLVAEAWECQVFIDKTRGMKKRDDVSDALLYAVL